MREFVLDASFALSWCFEDEATNETESVLTTLQNQQGQVRQALASNVELAFEGQETTVFRFRLDEKGELIADSMNRIHKNLRAAGRS